MIITIMVLDLRPPAGGDLGSLAAVGGTFAAYVMSFMFVGIYWNNHHHLLRASAGIDGRAMWANLHLLFWLSLVPFCTSWLGEHPAAAGATALYGVVLFMNALAYVLLQRALVAVARASSGLARAVGNDRKGLRSLVFYLAAICFAFVFPPIADLIFAVVVAMWFLPDRRFETVISRPERRQPCINDGPGWRDAGDR